jgi:hypothetical protein
MAYILVYQAGAHLRSELIFLDLQREVCRHHIELVVLVQLDNLVDNGMSKPHDLGEA